MNGLLLIDKPKGITSFDVIRRLRRQTGVKKIGHAGTLDPMATGLMLMLFGTGTKSAQTFVKLDKEYLAEVTLGANSTTQDAEGEITPISDKVPTQAELEKALEAFRGPILQTPSKYSAIKVAGKEAYKYARAGQSVELPPRAVTVHELVLIRYEYPNVDLRASVSSGTYIRSIADDLGGSLQTGAYLSGLRRTKVGEFVIADALELEGADAETVVARLIPL